MVWSFVSLELLHIQTDTKYLQIFFSDSRCELTDPGYFSDLHKVIHNIHYFRFCRQQYDVVTTTWTVGRVFSVRCNWCSRHVRQSGRIFRWMLQSSDIDVCTWYGFLPGGEPGKIFWDILCYGNSYWLIYVHFAVDLGHSRLETIREKVEAIPTLRGEKAWM